MRQTLQVLQLSTLELSQKINDALEDNPLLEICESSEEVSEGNTSEATKSSTGTPKETTLKSGKRRPKKHFKPPS